jgi:hypothetical protein
MALFGSKASLLPTSPNPFVTASGPVWDEGASIPQVPQNPMPKKGGLFGKQSALWKVLGVLGDGITGNPMFTQSYLGQKEDERRSLMMEQQRQAQLEDYAKKQEIEARYKAPPQPTEFERLAGAAYGEGTPEYLKAVRGYVETRASPMMPVQGVDAQGNPTLTFIPRNQGGHGAPQQGRIAIGQPYVPQGGQTAAPSGNFPR